MTIIKTIDARFQSGGLIHPSGSVHITAEEWAELKARLVADDDLAAKLGCRGRPDVVPSAIDSLNAEVRQHMNQAMANGQKANELRSKLASAVAAEREAAMSLALSNPEKVSEAVLTKVNRAIAYGLKHGFLEDRAIDAAIRSQGEQSE